MPIFQASMTDSKSDFSGLNRIEIPSGPTVGVQGAIFELKKRCYRRS